MRACIFLMAVVLFLFHGCSSADKIPSGILSPDKMSEVFFDLTMAEGYVENFHAKDSSRVKDSVLTGEVDKILLIRKISQQQFRESYDFYKLHPPLFKVVIDSAYDKAQRNREEMFKKPIVDSLLTKPRNVFK